MGIIKSKSCSSTEKTAQSDTFCWFVLYVSTAKENTLFDNEGTVSL